MCRFFKKCEWFFVNSYDFLNARVPKEDYRERKKAYGLSLDVQNNILDAMSKTMRDLRVKGKKMFTAFSERHSYNK